MIKLTFCLKRKPGMSLAEFQDYWLNHHGPLVRSHKDALQIRKYVQLHSSGHAADDGLRASRAASLEAAADTFDGVAQLWFDSFDSLATNGENPAAAAAGRELLEDERKFIDLANSPLWFGEEHEII
jgi:hypothetical protein